MSNGKAMKFAGGWGKLLFELTDIGIHFLFERINESRQFAIGPFHHQFDATIRQVSDIAANVVLQSDILSGVPESNPLNAP